MTILLLFLISVNCLGQKMPDIDTVDASINGPNFMERSSIDSAYFRVGQSILVNVLCDRENPKSYSSGIIKHSYYELENIYFESAFYIRDTILIRSILHYEGKNISKVLGLFGLKSKDFERVQLFTKYYSEQVGNKVIKCWLKRNQILYEEQLIE